MDDAPNTRPGWLPALATGGALLLVLAMLFGPAFSGEEILRTGGQTISEWDQHFAEGAWDSQTGMGQPRPAARGFTGLFQTLCGISPDPAANFANYYPLACLFLLGMAAWLCFRQLNCSGLVCGIGALAAALNGFFFSRALEFSGDTAIAGAGMFVALAMILSPRFAWPHGLIAGLALGVGILETGSHGIVPALAVGGIALAVIMADSENQFTPCRLIALAAMALGLVMVGWPMFADSPPAGRDLDLFDLLTLPVAGLFGNRADVANNSQHWGSLAGSYYHLHAGALVLLGAAWALMNTLRKGSSYSGSDKFRVFLFCGVALVSLLAMLGGFSGGSPLILFSVALLVVFALGLKGLDEWLASKAHEKTRGFGSGGFDSAWRIGLFALLALATVAFALYSGRTEDLVKWFLQKNPDATKAEVDSLISTSILQAGLFVLFLFLSVVGLTACSFLKWNRTTRTAGLLALGLLLALDLGGSGAPFLRFDALIEHNQPNPMAQNLQRRATAGRVALLNNHRPLGRLPLDQLVMDSFLEPPSPDAYNLTEETDRQLAPDFQNALLQYRSAEHVRKFNQLLVTMLRPPNDATAKHAFQLLQTLPGGREFLTSDNENIQAYFVDISLSRYQQMLAHENLSRAWHQDWSRYIFPKLGISRARLGDFRPPAIDEAIPQARPEDIRQGELSSNRFFPVHSGNNSLSNQIRTESIRLLIRQWELSSTRFFLCHAGNESLSKQVRAEYSNLTLPTYRNALNKTLDPILRRFRFVESFELGATNSPPVVLMEFLGALPRASLLADWQTGVTQTNAAQILYRPGFDPHTRVLLEQTDVTEPEQPSQSWNVPKVEFVDAHATRVELKIPPTDFGTVLLLNDRHDPNWTATLDGQPAPILRANNHARAVHLPASNAHRTVVFTYQPPTAPTMALLLIGLVAAGIGIWRRQIPSEKSSAQPDSDTKPDET